MTKRQWQYCAALATGYSHKWIAQKLGLKNSGCSKTICDMVKPAVCKFAGVNIKELDTLEFRLLCRKLIEITAS
jgi:hypothetical protein